MVHVAEVMGASSFLFAAAAYYSFVSATRSYSFVSAAASKQSLSGGGRGKG